MSLRLVGRKVFKQDIEKKIATAAIVSMDFCKEIFSIYKPEYLRIDYIRRVVNWCMDYYKRYKTNPGKQIQDIFNSEKEEINFDEAEITKTFLLKISKEHEEEEVFNWQYVFDQAKNYFKERSLFLLFERGLGYVSRGKIEEAEKSVLNYGVVGPSINNWIDPFSLKEAKEVLYSEREILFNFPGSVGELIGGFDRTWLCGFMGPMKRGKSWFLQEVAFQAVLSGLHVLFVSLEMSQQIMKKRLYQRIVGFSGERERVLFPVFDCVKNQKDVCRKSTRIGDGNLCRSDGTVIDRYDSKVKHKVCVECRGKKDFQPAVWWKLSRKLPTNKKRIIDKIKRFSTLHKEKFKLVCYPAFSASVEDIEREIDLLENTKGIVPDVVVVDYADILLPSNRGLSERGVIDDIWKRLKKMAATRYICVVTASQSNRGSMSKRTISEEDTAEDIRKIAHVDFMVSLNQTKEEKVKGIHRLGMLAHRHRFFTSQQVTVLEQLRIGAPILDSEWT